MSQVDKVMGIDLGTTASVASLLSLDEDRVLLGRHSEEAAWSNAILPSMVAELPVSNELAIGWEARARRGLEPNPILSIKRQMGTPTTVTLQGQQVTPEYVSSLILKRLVENLRKSLPEDHSHVDLVRAVITVPAHFKHPAQEATRRAGEMAGIQVEELLHEPIAAAIHYCWKRGQQ
ncbi:MAG: Hsp70 family protein, partial [Planctomycetaceae bacterium]|nr:Hsp70 family protein [Planctomycetaceae bacterium]